MRGHSKSVIDDVPAAVLLRVEERVAERERHLVPELGMANRVAVDEDVGHGRDSNVDDRGVRGKARFRKNGRVSSTANLGLEGVVAFETEIAEPDKEGSALRYRGVDIEELAGHGPLRAGLGPRRQRVARRTGCRCRRRTSSPSSLTRRRARRPPGDAADARGAVGPEAARRHRRRPGAAGSRAALVRDALDRRPGPARRRAAGARARRGAGQDGGGAVPHPLARRGGRAARRRRSTSTGSPRPSTA